MKVPQVKQQLERHKGKLTLTGAVTAASLMGAVLYSFGTGLVKLNHELGASGAEVDSLQAQVSWLLDHRCDCGKKKRTLRTSGRVAVEREGVVRRVWRLLF